MRALGIAVKVSKLRSTVRLVLIEGARGADETTASVVEQLSVAGDETDWATHVGNVAQAVRGHAKSMKADTIVVRRADQAPQGRNSDGPKIRLMIEGGIVAACLDVTHDVRITSGQECGKARDTTKVDLDGRAEAWLGRTHGEAAAAALSGLV